MTEQDHRFLPRVLALAEASLLELTGNDPAREAEARRAHLGFWRRPSDGGDPAAGSAVAEPG
jgi:hypothetical protein